MDWNFDMEKAPRGETREHVWTNKKGKECKKTFHRGERILTASKCGKVIVSDWLEKEGRWNCYSKGSGPIAWMALPIHPEAKQ